MKNTIKKIEEIIESLYIKELLGITLYDNIHNYVQLNNEVEELRQIAFDYELLILSNKPADKTPLIEKINKIHGICITIEEYRPSRLLFNEEGILDNEIM